MRPIDAHARPIVVADMRHLVCRRLHGKAFPDSRGPGNPKLSAHCQGPGNGRVRHSVVSLCAAVLHMKHVPRLIRSFISSVDM